MHSQTFLAVIIPNSVTDPCITVGLILYTHLRAAFINFIIQLLQMEKDRSYKHSRAACIKADVVGELRQLPGSQTLQLACLVANSLVPRPHPHREEKGSGYNMTSRPTLEGRNQHTIVSDHVLTNAIYGILSMPRGPHCGAYYSVL